MQCCAACPIGPARRPDPARRFPPSAPLISSLCAAIRMQQKLAIDCAELKMAQALGADSCGH